MLHVGSGKQTLIMPRHQRIYEHQYKHTDILFHLISSLSQIYQKIPAFQSKTLKTLPHHNIMAGNGT